MIGDGSVMAQEIGSSSSEYASEMESGGGPASEVAGEGVGRERTEVYGEG